MTKLDVRKAQKALYTPSAREFQLVDVPPMLFLMIDGAGDPATAPAYKEAVEALYPVAYTLKFQVKTEQGLDYVVPPLEGLWWADDPSAFVDGRRDLWRWTMMIRVPDGVAEDAPAQALFEAERKKGLPAIRRIRVETLAEGRCAQILHVGPYADEGPTLARLHDAFMPANGLTFAGKHHEIYLSDARKTAPEKLKTILRQPVRAA
jgi:hypothetical protein